MMIPASSWSSDAAETSFPNANVAQTQSPCRPRWRPSDRKHQISRAFKVPAGCVVRIYRKVVVAVQEKDGRPHRLLIKARPAHDVLRLAIPTAACNFRALMSSPLDEPTFSHHTHPPQLCNSCPTSLPLAHSGAAPCSVRPSPVTLSGDKHKPSARGTASAGVLSWYLCCSSMKFSCSSFPFQPIPTRPDHHTRSFLLVFRFIRHYLLFLILGITDRRRRRGRDDQLMNDLDAHHLSCCLARLLMRMVVGV